MQTIPTKQAQTEFSYGTKQDLLADMSHEIRTPIGAIVGLGHLLMSTNLDCRQRQYMTVLQSSAEALLAMVNRMLDISEVESRTINLQNTPFDMSRLLADIVTIMSVKAQEKNIGLTLHYEAGAPESFFGDSGRIRQIVMNLVGNAIKFTAAGEVAVFFTDHAMKNGKRKISISVMDTGIGIPQDKIDMIFGRFVQANPSIARKYGGTGLGLAISKALAKNMGGTLAVTSLVGKGSTFVLRLQLPVETNGNERRFRENVIYVDADANTKMPLAPQFQYAESCGKL